MAFARAAQPRLPVVWQGLTSLQATGRRGCAARANAMTQRGVHWAEAGRQSARGNLKKGPAILLVHDDGSEKKISNRTGHVHPPLPTSLGQKYPSTASSRLRRYESANQLRPR